MRLVNCMTVILIDAKNALFRFGHVHRHLKTSDGVRTGAVYGVVGAIIRLKKRYPDARFVLVWDGEGKTWRHELYPHYKGNRKKGKESPQAVRDILAQVGTLEQVADILGLIQIKVPCVEADDLIGILAARCLKREWKPIVYSSDMDFMQLMCKGVTVISKIKPESNKTALGRFGCAPDRLLELRALVGDKSDNIPNAYPGLGPKTGLKLLAAGVRPGVKDGWPLQPVHAGVRAAWATIRLNYKLMRILTLCKSKVLPVRTQLFLKASIACVMSELVALQNPGKRSGHRSFVNALAGLELAEALENKHLLWRLQCDT